MGQPTQSGGGGISAYKTTCGQNIKCMWIKQFSHTIFFSILS